MRMTRIVCLVVGFEALVPTALSDGRESPRFGAFGLDLTAQDQSVKPGDDFFRYAEGRWLDTAKIPPDRTSWGVFDELAVKSENDVREILERTAAAGAPAGTNEQKIGDFYQAFLDTDHIERLGLSPAQDVLAAIARLATHEQVAALIAKPGLPLDGPIGLAIGLDQKNPDRYVVTIGQSGLSLPDRDYYLKTEQQFVDVRTKFERHVEKMLALAGHQDAKKEAGYVLAVETAIAKLHWERAKRRERDLTYNLMSVAALERDAPAYPWAAAFEQAGLSKEWGARRDAARTAAAGTPGAREVVVAEWSAVPELAQLFKRTPVSTWKAYLTYQYLTGRADVLPKALDEENFDFNGRILNGQPEQRDRWKRAVRATNRALGEAVGELYVAKHFPPESKAAMEQLVENLRKGYAEHIAGVPWMTPETKQVALEKLKAFRSKIGYPLKWRDYSRLEVRPGDAFGNQERAERFEWNRQLVRLDTPTDRDEWGMTPQRVNAYYNPTFNEIVFPAAILQPPFFDPRADAAVNYGAIGGVIGHEMGHGFDDQGAKSDAKGVLHTWWKQQDIDAFKQRTDRLADQYGQFEPLRGLRLNGRLTLGENIGDLGGLTIAHDAYLISLNGASPPRIYGLTAEQRFFLSWAQVWRALNRDEALRNEILTDPHSPEPYRVNGVVRNVDAWYAAFDVKPGDRLYLAPDQRVHIW
ncbi:MAG: M13 family metallopeptidase [Gammaproteobacteria bacterium]|nr:M13 family metallopeptidase [Gammaproteobacteria bacterium]